MAVSKRLRFEILRRDNHQCRYCGAQAPDIPLRVDHVVPVALGGSDDPSNLVTACEPCNTGKSSIAPDSPVVTDVSADALRWSRAMGEVARIRAQQREDRLDTLGWFNAVWCEWTYGPHKEVIPLPAGSSFETIFRFLDAGLTRDEIADMVRVAMRASHVPPAKTWQYFCGCCWRRIRENADMAQEILNAEEVDGGA